jgi:spermidine synthase
VVIATGISSVVTQLLTIREFLTQFQGNEIVIALILFNWLILGGIGTFLARIVTRKLWRPAESRLSWLSFCLCALSILQILGIRTLRDLLFIPGSSVGFYPTWLYTFLIIAPYCMLLGFVLPYSLFVLKRNAPAYPGARIYITDNIGDIAGGALFSFVLVYLVTPLQAIFIAHLPLIVTIYLLFPADRRKRPPVYAVLAAVTMLLVSGIFLEKPSLKTSAGDLVHYRETRYGRIAVYQDHEQYTLFQDGIPVFSSQNLAVAEETIHYPMAQTKNPGHVLLISAEGGVMAELDKYDLQSIDYVELDPEVTRVQFQFDMVAVIPGLNVVHRDGRAYLSHSKKTYDAIIVNLPEPTTFQVNRFYTGRFFELAKSHLTENGVLSFSMQGFDNYLAEPQRQKLSSLFNTVSAYFQNVLLLPGQKVFFLCSDDPIRTDIPDALSDKNISTSYISGFYSGNLTPKRIERLNQRLDPSTPMNHDNAPFLMRVMFTQWFAKYQTSPIGFIVVLGVLTLVYLLRTSREEYVLFSTGCITMGSEILVIFAFQIFFGYIYLQIGIIITIFLAGLLPGAWIGAKLQQRGKQVLAATDIALIIFLLILILALEKGGDRLTVSFFLGFGFMVSLACGFQFPVALNLGGDDNAAASRSFSADLIGAACGTLLTSVVLIPYFGIIWATMGLVGLKLSSLLIILVQKTKAE